jgi:hypothetical protein
LLTLPDPQAPEVTVLHRDQGWWLETEDGLEPITDGKLVATCRGSFRLCLPEPLPPTRDAMDAALTLASLALSFMVRDGGRSVELVALRGERRIELKTRAHHAPLLVLARARLAERARPGDEQGWVHQEDLIRRLDYDSGRLHVEIHRARRQLAQAGILDAVHVVERREGTRLLRIGVAKLEIDTIDPTPESAAKP